MGPMPGLQLDGQLVVDVLAARPRRASCCACVSISAGGVDWRCSSILPLSTLAVSRISVEQAQEVEAGGVHGGEDHALAGRDLAFEAAQEQLGEAEDRVERRAQIVAHVGEELRLQAPRLLGALDGEERLDGEARDALEQAIDGHGHAAHLGGGDGAERLRLFAVGDAGDLLGHAARVARHGACRRVEATTSASSEQAERDHHERHRRDRAAARSRRAARRRASCPPSARST